MNPNKSKRQKSEKDISQVGFPYSSGDWTASFVEHGSQNMLNFEDYCRFRSSMQMQILINNRQTKVFGADDQMFAGLILMEQQWQYSRRMESFQGNENGSFVNFMFRQKGSQQEGSASNKKERAKPRCSTKKKKVKKYEGKPRKPLTSFMLFLRDFRKTLIDSKPITEKASSNEINKLAGKQWHLLPENLKQQYKKQASNALETWKTENFPIDSKESEAFNIKLPNEDKENILIGQSNTDFKMENINVSDKRLSSSTTSASAGDSSSEDSSGSESSFSST